MSSGDDFHSVQIIWPDSDQWPATTEIMTAWIADAVINEVVIERLESRDGEEVR